MALSTFTFSDNGRKVTYNSGDLAENARRAATAAMNIEYAVKHGMEWYSAARLELIEIAAEYGYTLPMVAASAAILSSCMPWERNIPAMLEVFEAYRNGKRGKELPGVSRNFECVRKIERILGGGEPSHNIVKRGKSVAGQSYKTLNFFYNLMGGANFVTVDVHMWRALSGDGKTTHRPDGHLYIECANIFRALAAEFNVQPMQLQAIVWMTLADKVAGAHKA